MEGHPHPGGWPPPKGCRERRERDVTRFATMTYALLLACFLVLAAGPAYAQLPDVGNAVGDVLDGGGSKDDGGSTNDGGSLPGGSLTDTVGDVLNDDGENTSSGSDDDGTSSGSLLDDVVKTIDNTTDPVKDTADGGAETLDKATGGATGGYYDGISGSVDSTLDGTGNVVNKITHNDGKKGTATRSQTHNRTSFSDDSDVFGKRFEAALAADQKRRLADAAAIAAKTVAVADQPEENVVQQIGRVAAEAAEQMAFPVILLLMVGAFLVGQNRVDRRDPKLALAPVDLDADLLSFT